jgi:hypothetical protein
MVAEVETMDTDEAGEVRSGNRTKYEYPEGVDSPEARKKYRRDQRKARAAAEAAKSGTAPAPRRRRRAAASAEDDEGSVPNE